MEIWKPIPGYENFYEVSNMGHIKSVYRYKKILKPMISNSGYKRVDLFKKGVRKQVSVHRIVAEVFVANPFNKTFVNHKNEIKTDNRADNLEWVTHKENCNYGTAIQRRLAHTDYSNRTINNANQIKACSKPILQYSKNGEFIRAWNSASECARINGWCISNIRRAAKKERKTAYGFVFTERSDDLSHA